MKLIYNTDELNFFIYSQLATNEHVLYSMLFFYAFIYNISYMHAYIPPYIKSKFRIRVFEKVILKLEISHV